MPLHTWVTSHTPSKENTTRTHLDRLWHRAFRTDRLLNIAEHSSNTVCNGGHQFRVVSEDKCMDEDGRRRISSAAWNLSDLQFMSRSYMCLRTCLNCREEGAEGRRLMYQCPLSNYGVAMEIIVLSENAYFFCARGSSCFSDNDFRKHKDNIRMQN